MRTIEEVEKQFKKWRFARCFGYTQGIILYTIDSKTTSVTSEHIEKLMNLLFKKYQGDLK